MINFFFKSTKTKSKKQPSNNNSNPILEYCVVLYPPLDDTIPKVESSEENEIKTFMDSYVSALFTNSASLSLEQKATFGKYVQGETGQTWFARIVNAQRVQWKCVSESTFFSLVQHFAIVLFECANSDYFPPAKSLMNMCFTFYHEVQVPGCEPFREYLSTYLRSQPIWQSLRFWNAAFFNALQCARIQTPVFSHKEPLANSVESDTEETQYMENITFGQLGTFICNMHAFGLDKCLCADFLQKQHTIASLSPNQEKILQDHLNRLYEQTDPYV